MAITDGVLLECFSVDIILLPGFNPGPHTGAGNNTYLIPGETPTLIDAATGVPAHLAALTRALVTRSLSQVLVTHGHSDHVDGCDQIAQRWPSAVFKKMSWPERDRLQSVKWVPIGDGDRIHAGSGVLRVLHTPGHAPDHLCFFDEKTGTLFSADLVVPGSTVVIPACSGGSLSQYLASLRRVLALDPIKMLPAHGPAIDDPATVLNQYLEHRQRREDQIIIALRAGRRRPSMIVDHVYRGLKPELKGLAQQSVMAHLVKLRDEGRIRLDGDEWVLN